MKKIIFLSMSANFSPYIEEEEAVKETWAKDIIDGKYEGCSFYGYSASPNQENYTEGNHIYVDALDDLNGTYNKTYKCFKFLLENYDFDYIVRTNTSTYINVQLVVDFINQLPEDDDKIYCTRLIQRARRRDQFPGGRPAGLFFIMGRQVLDDVMEASKSIGRRVGVDDFMLFMCLYRLYHRRKIDWQSKIVCYDMRFPIWGINYSYEDYNGIFCARLKLHSEDRSNIIPLMQELHTAIQNEEKRFELPQHLSTQGVNYNYNAQPKPALKEEEMSKISMMSSPAVRRAILRRPLERGASNIRKRIQFRGVK